MLTNTDIPLIAPMRAECSPVRYDRETRTFCSALRLINVDREPLIGRLQVIIAGLPAGVSLADATGSYWGNPSLWVELDEILLPGASITLPILFRRKGFWSFLPFRYDVLICLESRQWECPSDCLALAIA